jgi:hypothetical protein
MGGAEHLESVAAEPAWTRGERDERQPDRRSEAGQDSGGERPQGGLRVLLSLAGDGD